MYTQVYVSILIRCVLYYTLKINLPQYFQLVMCEREDDHQAKTLRDELPQFLSR